VALFEGTREIRRIRRALPPRMTSDRLGLEEVGEAMRIQTESGERVCDSREVVEQRGVASVIPAVGRLALAPDGGLWVERGGVRGEPRAIDLFTDEGIYRGTLPEGTPFPIAFFPDGRIAAPHTDELEVTRLVVYRVREG
jgi:hypothetical protein